MEYIYTSLILSKMFNISHNEVLLIIGKAPDSFKQHFNIVYNKKNIPISMEITEIGKLFIMLCASSEIAKQMKIELLNDLKKLNPAVVTMINTMLKKANG